MGNSDSHGGLHIDLENPNALAGSMLAGVIHLVVKETTEASSLELLFKGKEYTHFAVKSGKSTRHYYGHRRVLWWEMPLYVFSEGKVDPGHYTFPFTVTVPDSVPGTFLYREDPFGHQVFEAKITYKLCAKVLTPHNLITKAVIPLSITQTKYAAAATTSSEHTAHVTTWCCLGNGTVTVRSETDKGNYMVGENAQMDVKVGNKEGDLQVVGVTGSLVRSVVIRADNGTSRTCSSVISTASVPVSIPPHQFEPETSSISLPIISDDNQTNTVESQLVLCKYEIKGEAELNGCVCCGDAPVVAKPVVIYPRHIPRSMAPELPEEWKALVRANTT